MTYLHAVAWIDHQQARVIHFNADDSMEQVLHASHPTGKARHKSNPRDSTGTRFLQAVAQALSGTPEILILGPGGEKNELIKHLEQHHKAVAACIVAVQAADHPSDGQLLAQARKYFRAADRML